MFKVFTRPACSFCERAKDLLSKLDIPYEEYKLSDKGDGVKMITADQMFEIIGKKVKSIPQIMDDDKLIGGYTDLREYLINEGRINFRGEIVENH